MNAVQSALSSRRFNRWLLVVGVVVLVAGTAAVLLTFFRNTAKPENTAPGNQTINIDPKKLPNIRFPADAWKVVQKFVFTAVSRKQLAASYAISDANVRGGFTLAQWKTGNIPVPYFPASRVIRYNWKNTNFSHPRDAAVNLILLPANGSNQRAGTFIIEVIKKGHGANAHWVVDYFGAVQGVPVPSS